METVLVLLLAWAAASDGRSRTIPNACTGTGAALFAAAAIGEPPGALLPLAFGLGLLVPLAGASLARPRSLGMGDAKLAGMLGLALGPVVLPALACAMASALAEAVLRSARRSAQPGGPVTIALAPHLAFGAALAVGLVG